MHGHPPSVACRVVSGPPNSPAPAPRRNACGLTPFSLPRAQIFLRFYHTAELAAHLQKHTGALQFLQKIAKAHVARERYTVLVRRSVPRGRT